MGKSGAGGAGMGNSVTMAWRPETGRLGTGLEIQWGPGLGGPRICPYPVGSHSLKVKRGSLTLNMGAPGCIVGLAGGARQGVSGGKLRQGGDSRS